MRSIIFAVALLLLTACSQPGSKLVGKWSVDSELANYFKSKAKKDTTKSIIEFTKTEMIRDGSHDPIEMADQGNDVVVYRTMFGIKSGTTYKFIDKDTAEVAMLGDKQTLHRIH